MTGIVLKHLGHHVRIFERYPATQMEGQGAGITAQVDVQQLLTDYGLLKPPYSVNSPNLQILKLDGSVKSTWNVAWEMTSWDALYFRLRAVFDGHRSEYCPQALELGAQQTGSGENPRKRDTRPSICRASEQDDAALCSYHMRNGLSSSVSSGRKGTPSWRRARELPSTCSAQH